jgi:hypothetical protein
VVIAALLLLAMQEIKAREYLLLGIVSDATGIQKYGIGVFQLFANFISCHTHN